MKVLFLEPYLQRPIFNQENRRECRPHSRQELTHANPVGHETPLLLRSLMLLRPWPLLPLTLTDAGLKD